MHHLYGDRETNALNLVVSPTSDAGQIHLNPAAIWFTPTFYLDLQSVSFLVNPTSIQHFLLQLASYMSPYASLSSFDFQSQNLMPFLGHGHPLSSTHDYANEHCHCQVIYGVIQTHHDRQILRSFSFFELYSTHCSYDESFCMSHSSISLYFSHRASLLCSIASLR